MSVEKQLRDHDGTALYDKEYTEVLNRIESYRKRPYCNTPTLSETVTLMNDETSIAPDNQIEKINNFIRNQAEPDYVDEILNFADEKDTGNIQNNGDKDELYQTAIEIVKSEGKASTSFLQRKLQIGYNRAARIIDMMEEKNIVRKANHVGKREVL